jgi:hypothetical protein
MSTINEDTKLLAQYEAKFVDMVIRTYDIVNELDRARDEEFWILFDFLEAAYIKIENTKDKYYAILTKDGQSAKGCSLEDEFNYGIYGIDEKYSAIKDKVKRFSLKPM